MEKILLNCYKDFKCIANKCPKTCCENWEIEVDEKTLENYKMINSEYSKKILANLYHSNEKTYIRRINGRCAFLNDDNLCDIIINLGENALSEVCFNHPRFIYELGKKEEISFSLSCPESVRLLLAEDNLSTITTTDDRQAKLNDIDAEKYFWLENIRDGLMKTVQNPNLSLIKKLINIYETVFNKSLKSNIVNEKQVDKIIKKLTKLNSIDPAFIKALSTDVNFDIKSAKIEKQLSNVLYSLLFYHTYKPLFYNTNIKVIINYIIFEILILIRLSKMTNNLSDAIISFSHEIEHDEDNFRYLLKLLKNKKLLL